MVVRLSAYLHRNSVIIGIQPIVVFLSGCSSQPALSVRQFTNSISTYPTCCTFPIHVKNMKQLIKKLCLHPFDLGYDVEENSEAIGCVRAH